MAHAAWIAAAAIANINDATIANRDYYMAPAYETVNVTFSCMFNCKANQWCWTQGTGTGMNGFNRDMFYEYVATAVNQQSVAVEPTPAARFMLDKKQIVVDRIVEKTGPTALQFIGTSNVALVDWNVLTRVTLLNIPTVIGDNFKPVTKNLFTNDDLYGDAKAELLHPCWISTEAYFIDDQLEPFGGRGHKDQTLLIPLIVGLTFMLMVPMCVVSACVFRAQAENEKRLLLEEEEQMAERLSREAQEKESIVITKQKLEDELQEKGRKSYHESEELRKRELTEDDCAWIEKKTKTRELDFSFEAPPPKPQPVARAAEDDGKEHNIFTLQESEADCRVRILSEAEEDFQHIRLERLKCLPLEHRVKKMLKMHIHRWKFARIKKLVWRRDKERQKIIAKKKVGSIQFGVDRVATEEVGAVVIGSISTNPAGGMPVSQKAGLRKGDVLVYIKYDERGDVEGEARDPEPLEDPQDLRFAVGPSKQVYEGSRIYFSYLRGDAQMQAWVQSLKDPSVKKVLAQLKEGGAGALAQAIKIKSYKARMKVLERQGMPVNKATVEVGVDSSGAQAGRKKHWQKIKDCGLLNVAKLDIDNVESYLSDPELCKKACLMRFREADKDGSNSLDRTEIHTVFKQLAKADGLPEPSRDETRRMYDRVDLDGSGSISFEEFFPFFRRRIVEIIVGLEKEKNDIDNEQWKASDFDPSRVNDMRHTLQEYFESSGELKFEIEEFNRIWKVKGTMKGNNVRLVATSRHGAAFGSDEQDDNLEVVAEFVVKRQ